MKTLLTEPEQAKALLRDRFLGQAPAFLDTPEGPRAFAEALLLLKLSDMSRGEYSDTPKALGRSSVGRELRTAFVQALASR